jgi:polyhydroxybutyrate depolymerase
MNKLALLASLLALPSCGGETGLTDAGGVDAGSVRDAGGAIDGGSNGTDAGSTDDAGASIDAGSPGDAGTEPAPEGCITSVAAGHHVFTCEELAMDVEVSASCALGGCGLILDVHGATMNAAEEDANTEMRALGSARGYVVVQPNAPAGGLGTSWDPDRDDPKVFAFVQLAMRAFRIDPDRVHITGFSQGGFMTWRMLCDHADVFASVAPAAACGGLYRHCAFTDTERPSREIPVLYVHGHADTIVANCEDGQRDNVVEGWAMTEDSVLSMDDDHTWTRYVSASGNVFEYIEHDYTAYSTILAGHCFPGSTDIGTEPFGLKGYGCEQTSPFVWGQAVIAFFQAHPR